MLHQKESFTDSLVRFDVIRRKLRITGEFIAWGRKCLPQALSFISYYLNEASSREGRLMKRVFRFAICTALLAASVSSACLSAPTVVKEFTLPIYEGKPFRPRVSGDYVVSLQNADDRGCASQTLGVGF